jgi:hypothetical protein
MKGVAEIHVNYTVAQDETGVWCADAPAFHAHGYGDTREQAVDDLREAVLLVVEDGLIPEDLAVSLDDVA